MLKWLKNSNQTTDTNHLVKKADYNKRKYLTMINILLLQSKFRMQKWYWWFQKEKSRKLKKKKKSTKTGHVEAEKKLNNYITLYAKLINDLSE